MKGEAERTMHTTLPRRFYADPAFYRAELERFYFNRWIYAGRADQIPDAGDYFVRVIGDESVIVTRDGSGEFHALFNVCRHRGTRLCEQTEGHFADRIQCPYHNWTYGLDGHLLAAPHMPPDFNKADYAIAADVNPGVNTTTKSDPKKVNTSSASKDIQLFTNSSNHQRQGQNVLFGDGHVDFQQTAFCGVDQDNIYGPGATDGKTPRTILPPVVGLINTSPKHKDDSSLVPVENGGTY